MLTTSFPAAVKYPKEQIHCSFLTLGLTFTLMPLDVDCQFTSLSVQRLVDFVVVNILVIFIMLNYQFLFCVPASVLLKAHVI